jgi:pimeloyl-ACP methyl ester carboxylesterase
LRHHGDSYDYRHAPHQTSSSSSLEEHTTTTTTTNADDMSYRTMAQDVIHFCNVHGIAQIDTLIGHSIGGKVAQ